MESHPLCDSYEARFAELPAVFAPVLLALTHDGDYAAAQAMLIDSEGDSA